MCGHTFVEQAVSESTKQLRTALTVDEGIDLLKPAISPAGEGPNVPFQSAPSLGDDAGPATSTTPGVAGALFSSP